MAKTNEPERLRRGRDFQRQVQADWQQTAQGDITPEKPITKPSGRAGRIDVHAEGGDDLLVGVGEIKATDWDRMTDRAVHRNVARHASQVWTYIDSQLAEGREVSPGVIYPASPASTARRDLIESLLEEEGISVVWEDETTAECKARGDATGG